jgi:hypothetical protein
MPWTVNLKASPASVRGVPTHETNQETGRPSRRHRHRATFPALTACPKTVPVLIRHLVSEEHTEPHGASGSSSRTYWAGSYGCFDG